MTHPDLDLGGPWTLEGLAEDGKTPLVLPATVPGMVHLDLLASKLIPDPFWRDQAEACQWVEKRHWRYTRRFHIEESGARAWQGAVLHFEGLDTYACVTLNGQVLGESDNMFRPFEFPVEGALRPGENTLAVEFTPYTEKIAGKPLDRYPAAFHISDRLHVRRMQCTYYWDWVNRFVSCGIWRAVSLRVCRPVRLTDFFVQTTALDSQGAEILVQAEWSAQGLGTVWALLEVEDPRNHSVHRQRMPVMGNMFRQRISIIHPELWWPNGQGAQPLYRAKIRVEDENGALLDERRVPFGIRTIRLERLLDSPGSAEEARTRELRAHLDAPEKDATQPGESFRFLVNGAPIFMRGGNWVPADPFPSRVDAPWHEKLILKAKDAGYNMLRAWGGGIYEDEGFFDACDRHGILVAQDFQFACGTYPEDDPDFLEKLPAEAEHIIRRLRGRTCLAWWIGNNENGMHHASDSPAMPGRITADRILEPLLARLDPLRPFMSTSPFGGAKNTFRTVGDSHFAGWKHDFLDGDQRDYRERIDRTGRFQSECALPGAPPLAEALKFMTEADVFEPSRKLWEYHTKFNPHTPPGKQSIHFWVEALARGLFGVPEDSRLWYASLEYVQYEWVRLSLEAARRNQGYTWGMLFWMFNDCWPASGWSQLSYGGVPKAGWYGFKRAAAPMLLSMVKRDGKLQVWVTSDHPVPLAGTHHVHFRAWAGSPVELHAKSVAIPPGKSTCLLEMGKGASTEVDLSQGVLTAEIRGARLIIPETHEGIYGVSPKCDPQRAGENVVSTGQTCLEVKPAWYFDGMPHEMVLPKTELTVQCHGGGAHGALEISSPSHARVVTLSGDAEWEDNYFDLTAGECRRVDFRNAKGKLTAQAWNSDAVDV
jgi:beta-mannosidase